MNNQFFWDYTGATAVRGLTKMTMTVGKSYDPNGAWVEAGSTAVHKKYSWNPNTKDFLQGHAFAENNTVRMGGKQYIEEVFEQVALNKSSRLDHFDV